MSFEQKQLDADAQYNLGKCFHFGLGVVQDDCKAVEWYTKAAEQGHMDAQFYLGRYFYLGGTGVAQDWCKAVEWWTKAAEQGDSGAKEFLSKLRKAEQCPIMESESAKRIREQIHATAIAIAQKDLD